MALRQHYSRYHIMERLLEIIEDGGNSEYHQEELEALQQTVVQQQVAEYLEQQAHCPGCGKKRRRKGNHNPIVYRTLFGKLRLPNMRFFNCSDGADNVRNLQLYMMVRPFPPRLWNQPSTKALGDRHLNWVNWGTGT